VRTAVYLLNRSPTKALNNITPFEAWHGVKPKVSHLKIFGGVAHVKLVGPGISKLSDRSRRTVFIGYESGTKGYRLFDPSTNRLVVSRDVIFDEKMPWEWNNWMCNLDQQETDTFIVQYDLPDQNPTIEAVTEQPASPGVGTEASNSAGLGSGVGNNDSPLSQNTPGSIAAPNINYATPPSQHSENTFGGPLRFRTLSDLLDSTDEMQDYEYSGICLLAADEPGGVEDALEEDCWVKAMNSELKSIQDNNTWLYTNLPKGHKAIGLKWVYKVKRDPEGNVVKHKARLVAKRYAQRHGVDYEEVFAPVARLETVRLILALAASGKWEVHHMDVKSAFLNGELQEEVYVKQPPGFENPRYPGKVLKLQKALYGLKQAPRA